MQTVSKNSNHSDVVILQQLLSEYGYTVQQTGIFDAATEIVVRQFQKAKNLSIDGIVGQATWSALKDAKKLTYLVIHCTATPEGREVTSDEIRKWHLSPVSENGRGWKQVGYTDMIHLDGIVERLVENDEDNIVDIWEITNGVAGYNSISRHIVYVGGLDKQNKAKDTRTVPQKNALFNYINEFIVIHPHILIAGHNQFAKKDCPSFNVPAWLQENNISAQNIHVVSRQL